MPTYTPNNLSMYLAFINGAVSGMGVGGKTPTSPLPDNYLGLWETADLYARQCDIVWADSSTPNELEVEGAFLLSQAYWWNRLPESAPADYTSEDFNVEAEAIIAIIHEGDDYLGGLGITPPPWGGSSGLTLVPKEVVYGSGSDGVAQDTQFLRNQGAVIAPGALPGSQGGFEIDAFVFTFDGTFANLLSSAPIFQQPQGAHIASGNAGTWQAVGGATSTGTGASCGVVGGPATTTGQGGIGYARAGTTASGRPGSAQLQAQDGTSAFQFDNFPNLLESSYPLQGNSGDTDTLRFGVSAAASIPASGTYDVPATIACKFTMVFTGEVTGDLVIQMPTAAKGVPGGWTKIFDFSNAGRTGGTVTLAAGTATPINITNLFGSEDSKVGIIWLSDDGDLLNGVNPAAL